MANKKLTMLNGQMVTLQCKATYEGKNAIDKVMTLNNDVIMGELVEAYGGELNPDGVHVDLYMQGKAIGTDTITIPFGYDGKESGVEGVDISTVHVDVDVRAATLVLVPPVQPAVFEYDSFKEFDLPINVTDGTEQLVLNDPGISFQESMAMVDVVTVGPDMIMIKPNAGWVPTAGEHTGKIRVYYYTAYVDVEYTFNVPEPRSLTAVVQGGLVPTFTGGEKTLTITDNLGAPVTDATLVSVNISTERDAKNVYEYMGQYLRATDAPAGKYAFDYLSKFTGAACTLRFRVLSGGVEYDLNPVTVNFAQEPYTLSLNPAIIPKVSSASSVDVSVNMKRASNGTPMPVTGIWEAVGSASGATYSSVPTMPSQMRIRTFRLTNIPKTGSVAMLLTIRFTDIENNGKPTDILLQIPRVA